MQVRSGVPWCVWSKVSSAFASHSSAVTAQGAQRPPGRLCYPTLFLCRYPASTPCELTQLALKDGAQRLFFFKLHKVAYGVCCVLFFPSCVSLSLAITLSTQTSNRKERERQSSRLRMIQTCSGHGSSVENKVLRASLEMEAAGLTIYITCKNA